MKRIYTKLKDEKRDQIYECFQKTHSNYKTAYMMNVSPSSVVRVLRTVEVVKSGDKNLQNAFKESSTYVASTWVWAQRRFAPSKTEESVQVTGKLKADEVTEEIRELKNMLERHLTAVNTALTTILECWGVDTNDSRRGKT